MRIAIIGLGLLGSSMGLALKANLNPAPELIGCDISGQALRTAKRLKSTDDITPDADEAVKGAALVVLATPVRAMEEVLRTIAPHLDPGAVVTDTGSTKRQVLEWAARYVPEHAFVGGHPMTGRLTASSDGASADLYQGCTYCLIPPADTPGEAVELVERLVASVKAEPYFVDAAEHDGLVAGVSHLPMVLASALMRLSAREQGWREMSKLAAGSFATMTRLAEVDPTMLADICLTNGDNLATRIDSLVVELLAIKGEALDGQEAIKDRLAEAQDRRRTWFAEYQNRQGRPPGAEPAPASMEMPKSWLRRLADRAERSPRDAANR